MKRISLVLFLVVFSCFIKIDNVSAHPGRTNSSGCHTCKTNCSSWGLTDGENHCHSGSTYTNSRGQTFNSDGTIISQNNNQNNNSSNNINTPISKSSDTSLKSIKVDNENIELSENMEYTTFKSIVTVYAISNDNKASIEYNKNVNLEIGNNVVTIVVKSENGNIKEYKLNIVRKKELSDNKNIKIKVNNEELKFILYKNDDITVSHNESKINITYELEDNNAKVEIIGNENLKVGENEITVKVIAENGDMQEYKIVVEKYSKEVEAIGTIILIIIGIGFCGSLGYLAYYFYKNRKMKNSN